MSSILDASSEMEHYLLNLKAYEPYLISNSTIIEYKIESDINVEVKLQKLSIMDILENHFVKGNTKLYFKVNLFDDFGIPNSSYKKGSDRVLCSHNEIKDNLKQMEKIEEH